MNMTILDAPFPFRPPTVRADGVHLSDILKPMREEFLSSVYPSLDDMEEDERLEARMRMEAGFIWEDTLSRAFGNAFAPRYNDLCVDGVWMNPDGCVIQTDAPRRVDEYKFTSSYKAPDARVDWQWQVKAYCWAVGALVARFYVLHYNGVHRNDRGPTFKAYECVYTRLELQENWQMILNYGRKIGVIK